MTFQNSLWPRHSNTNEFTYYLDQYNEELKNDARRLFLGCGKGRLNLTDIGSFSQDFVDVDAFDEYVQRSRKAKLRMITIDQKSSWSRLSISEEMAHALLSHVEAIPTFTRMLSAFGQRHTESSEHVGSYDSERREETTSLCYLMKCVEKHGRNELKDPWSVRQFAVYERFLVNKEQSTFVAIHPSATKALERRLAAVKTYDLSPRNRVEIHAMFASSAAANWRGYITYLEELLEALDTKASIDPVRGGSENKRTGVRFTDTQDLYGVQDKLQRALYQLKANIEVIFQLLDDLEAVVVGEEGKDLAQASFSTALLDFKAQSQRVETLLCRANALSNLLHNIVSFRTLEELGSSSGHTAQILRLAHEDSQTMADLAQKAGRDTKTLKTITILTLVYLPATFVATLLGMGYIKVHYSADDHASIHFNSEMWVFVVLTIILVLVTFGVWGLSERKWLRSKLRMTEKPSIDHSLA